ncbi:MAG: SPOR domain-containing protein [Bacteroidales bacterium]|nr:SPOR domain-containing protein [Bacteroidales bacterium]
MEIYLNGITIRENLSPRLESGRTTLGFTSFFNIFVSVKKFTLVDIKKYIKQLIIENKGVVIPGLGGFTTEYEPAAFDVSENKFLPPTNRITFHAQYTFSDEKLIRHMAQQENTDPAEARIRLKEFVKKIKGELSAGKPVVFPEIGTLRKGPRGELRFTQDKHSNLLDEAYGLKDLESVPNETSSHPPVTHPQRGGRRKKLWITLLSAAVVLILIAVSWYLTDGYTHFQWITAGEETPREQAMPDPQPSKAMLDSIAREDSIKAVINQTIDVTTSKKEALFYQEPETPPREDEPGYREYHIIAGSFRKMENAEKFCDDLKAMGYEPEIIHSGQELIRISIYSYPDEVSALKKLYKLRETSEIKSVWILKSL